MKVISSILKKIYQKHRNQMMEKYRRHVSFGDLFTDRWERARYLGFGKGTSCYDNVLVIGNVNVGKNTWIGPNVILDGSGGLKIGDYCSISAGVQIYTHDTVNWSINLGNSPIVKMETIIGDGVYIGPNVVIQKGVEIGDRAIIGAMSFVNKSVPQEAKVFGIPAKII
ncbi:acyltransferase [Zooshikella marina]|uniref:acyltransferase n=1 Tax=Zooshikella ganghwensis TaxID=202772 RepID=UPI00041F841D|nr:acyltransferase [Zooshikella ganghwensis]MBU2704615.1 acyltransferase [Zooshikella ganghwensis]